MNKLYKCKKYEQIEHLSDVGLKIYGGSIEELFSNAAEGLFSLMSDLSKIAPVIRKDIIIAEKDIDLDGLLVLWLEKLLYKFEVEELLFSKFEVKGIAISKDMIKLEASAFGEKIDSNKHNIVLAIKAPTYHMLEIKKDAKAKRWVAKVIFDV